jgi:hypothetical protein
MSFTTNEGFFTFQSYLASLSPRAAMLLSYIRCRQAFNAKHKRGLPRFSNAWLAKYFRCSERQISRTIAECIKASLLTRIQNGQAPSLFRVVTPVEPQQTETSALAADPVESEAGFGDQLIQSNTDSSNSMGFAGKDQLAQPSPTSPHESDGPGPGTRCAEEDRGANPPSPPLPDEKEVGNGIEQDNASSYVPSPQTQPGIDVRAHAKRLEAINLAIGGQMKP